MRIDLHAHSTASDGTDSPAELVAAAHRAGLAAVAITDHDTTAGWAPAAAALPDGLRLVRGAELSCLASDGHGGQCTVHLLAYLFDPDAPAMMAAHEKARTERRARLRRMVERMAADGLPVDPDEVLAGIPADVTPGRPHVATCLLRAGVVSTVDEAFDRYLNDRGRYYIPSNRTPVLDALATVRAAGGVSVLAHAFAHHRGPTVTAEVITELAGAGLDGLEVDHPDHLPADRARLRGLAADLNLLVTGSSDYHGSNKTVRLGQESTDPAALDAILDRATGSRVLPG